jgi:hypothetical protein
MQAVAVVVLELPVEPVELVAVVMVALAILQPEYQELQTLAAAVVVDAVAPVVVATAVQV